MTMHEAPFASPSSTSTFVDNSTRNPTAVCKVFSNPMVLVQSFGILALIFNFTSSDTSPSTVSNAFIEICAEIGA